MSEKNEWKSIESAPKDGSLILLGCPDEGPDGSPALCLPGYWLKGWCDGPDDMGQDDGWVDVQHTDFYPGRSFGSPDYMRKGSQPTHWMPLPAAPGSTSSAPGDAQDGVTMLPDGSAFALASFPLPASHWLYAEREYAPGAEEPKELPAPILTHTQRDAVVAAVRYAVRGATMCGKEQDFDPDALVQNAVYALCGPYGSAAPAAGDALDSKRLKWIAQNAWALRDLDNGRKNSLVWQQPRTSTEGALDRLRAAVDAALAAQVPHKGDAA